MALHFLYLIPSSHICLCMYAIFCSFLYHSFPPALLSWHSAETSIHKHSWLNWSKLEFAISIPTLFPPCGVFNHLHKELGGNAQQDVLPVFLFQTTLRLQAIRSFKMSNIQFAHLAMQCLISAWQLSHLKKHITLVSQEKNFQDLDTLWKDP